MTVLDQAVTLAQLARILLPGGKGWLAMLAAYLDASGVTKSEEHFVMAGFVAPVEKWTEFEELWKGLLASPSYRDLLPEKNGKKYAHAKKMARWESGRREAFYLEANYLLRHTVSFAIGVTFKHSDYEAAYRGFPHTTKDGPYGFGFRCTMVACCKNIVEHHDNKPVSFLVEQGDPGQGGAEYIFRAHAYLAKTAEAVRREFNMTTYGVGFKEDFGALQAADMHAYTLLKHLKSPLGRQTGKYSLYFNRLLSNLMNFHFVIGKQDILDQRRIRMAQQLRKKEFGERRTLISSSEENE